MPAESVERPPKPPTARRGRTAWTWSDTNLLLDIALLVVFVSLCIAAVIVRFVFPPGPAARGWMLWGLDYDAWNGLQFSLLAVLAGGILVHVMFHWSWVCNVLAARLSRGVRGRVDGGLQTIYGVGLLIVLLNVIGITVAAALLSIRGPG
ncbi:MAG: DUF4405 domain-containing protein [Pirellulales bacterium]